MTKNSTDKIVIYDIGANNGDDIPYYLLKADLVVAIEANPLLIQQINIRFEDAINKGKLVVEDCVLSDTESQEPVSFFVHKYDHVLSQFPKPKDIENFYELKIRSRTISKIIDENGYPYYCKIDIEHYDFSIVKNMFESGIFPEYISAEIHNFDTLCLILGNSSYKSFNIVEGQTIKSIYRDAVISKYNGNIKYNFPDHSAGPFGFDIKLDWMGRRELMTYVSIFAISSSGIGKWLT